MFIYQRVYQSQQHFTGLRTSHCTTNSQASMALQHVLAQGWLPAVINWIINHHFKAIFVGNSTDNHLKWWLMIISWLSVDYQLIISWLMIQLTDICWLSVDYQLIITDNHPQWFHPQSTDNRYSAKENFRGNQPVAAISGASYSSVSKMPPRPITHPTPALPLAVLQAREVSWSSTMAAWQHGGISLLDQADELDEPDHKLDAISSWIITITGSLLDQLLDDHFFWKPVPFLLSIGLLTRPNGRLENHQKAPAIWGWVKTLVPSEPQNSW